MQEQLFDMSSYSLPQGAEETLPPSKKLLPVSFSSLPPGLAGARAARSVEFFFLSQAAFSWQPPCAILRAAKFTEEQNEITSWWLGVHFQAALLQQGRAEGQSSGCSSFLLCELGHGSQNRREQTGLRAGSCFRGMWINPPP